MGRTDYFDEPDAPTANSIAPSVTAFVLDEKRRLLLIHKVDNDYWALPGGAVELGESAAEAAVRETSEEAGIDITVTGLVGIYTDPRRMMAYDDGEVRQEFSICFRAEPLSGHLHPQEGETKRAAWLSQDEAERLDVHSSMRRRIERGFASHLEPEIT